MRKAFPAVLSVLCAAAPARAGESDVSGGRLDLMAGYWRHYFLFSPARISPEELARDAAANEGGLGDEIRRKGIDLAKPFVGWPFYYEFVYAGHGYSSPLTLLVRSEPPPPDWKTADFDDSAWQRERLPFAAGHPRPHGFSSEGEAISHGVGTAFFRQRIFVEDPAKVKRLALRLVYRGGAVVYVNGKEIGRGHLPAGEIAPDAGARCYPVRAYALQAPMEDAAMEVWLSEDKRRTRENFWKSRPLPEFPRYWGGTGRPLPAKPPCPEMVAYHAWWNGADYPLTKPEWEETLKVRNRILGPLEVPPALLRKGDNVVAVEIHRADLHPIVFERKRLGDVWDSMGGYAWSHCCLIEMEAEAEPPGSILMERPPSGVRAWPDDIHRRYLTRDFGPSEAVAAPARIVGARNGSFSCQVAVGTDRELRGLRASVSDLRSEGGAKIPASAVTVRYAVGTALARMAPRGDSDARDPESGQSATVTMYLQRLAGNRPLADREGNARQASEIEFFDHLSSSPPASVPAGSCRPVWITVAIPKDAAPGEYRGEIAVEAGIEKLRVPIRLRVMDWTLPDPPSFETVVALDQSPWAVARQYGVSPWSDEHIARMRASFRQLARVNNALLIVPVLLGSEFANGADSPVVFVRKADGSWGCDLSRAEKYLDAAIASGCVPKIVNFVVFNDPFYGAADKKSRVLVRDEASGRTEGMDLPGPKDPEARKMLAPFVSEALAMLGRRKLEKAACWGHPWDALGEGLFDMAGLLGDLAPGTGWMRSCHSHSKGMSRGAAKDPFSVIVSIFDHQGAMRLDEKTRRPAVFSHTGWKNPAMRLVFPRRLSTAITIYTDSVPFYYRLAPERAIVAGARGVGRMGADYWGDVYRGGWLGATVKYMLAPGPDGAESTARFECLVEGLQEAEARVFLEKKLEGDWAATEEGRAARAVLNRR
ncbi:MAG: hypothetical protein N3A38_10210, partial [Planctomycetota bacterium]|nr:hypothetical protein [Planctomycetota bacterium]